MSEGFGEKGERSKNRATEKESSEKVNEMKGKREKVREPTRIMRETMRAR